jgi:predicted DNA-binding transcriptional regulator AlpA
MPLGAHANHSPTTAMDENSYRNFLIALRDAARTAGKEPPAAQRKRFDMLHSMACDLVALHTDTLREMHRMRTTPERSAENARGDGAPSPAPRGEEPYLTIDGVLARLQLRSRSTVYARFPDLLSLRRGLGPGGGSPFVWIASEVDAWVAKQPTGRVRRPQQGGTTAQRPNVSRA